MGKRQIFGKKIQIGSYSCNKEIQIGIRIINFQNFSNKVNDIYSVYTNTECLKILRFLNKILLQDF